MARMTPNTLRALQVHLDGLSLKHDVRMVYTPMDMRSSCADCEAREVFVPPCDSFATYAVALHEVGHVVAPGGRRYAGATAQQKLRTEQVAWQWARVNAICWNEAMTEVERYGLGGYEQAALSNTTETDTAKLLDMIGQILFGGRQP